MSQHVGLKEKENSVRLYEGSVKKLYQGAIKALSRLC
jgi:hypothetical protein